MNNKCIALNLTKHLWAISEYKNRNGKGDRRSENACVSKYNQFVVLFCFIWIPKKQLNLSSITKWKDLPYIMADCFLFVCSSLHQCYSISHSIFTCSCCVLCYIYIYINTIWLGKVCFIRMFHILLATKDIEYVACSHIWRDQNIY